MTGHLSPPPAAREGRGAQRVVQPVPAPSPLMHLRLQGWEGAGDVSAGSVRQLVGKYSIPTEAIHSVRTVECKTEVE